MTAEDQALYEKALRYAAAKHSGQTRMGGLPYISHPVAVARILREKGYGVEYQLAGLFHDLLEDTDADPKELERLGGSAVLHAVRLLTKPEGYVMAEYVAGIRTDPMALAVKGADRLHNLRCALCAGEDFKRRYILETLDWYMDLDPEIPLAVRALAKSLKTPLYAQSLHYEPVEDALREAEDQDPAAFVRVRDLIPDIAVELRYATTQNFTGKRIYPFTEAWLRCGTVKKLQWAQELLKTQGFRLKIWDAYRPVEAQFKLWQVCPNATYVADPTQGFSDHSRGNTVDVTLLTQDGAEAAMPTEFDSFSKMADRDYRDVPDKEAVVNAWTLQEAMQEAGFVPYLDEWWHFSDGQTYPVEQSFQPPAEP